MRIIAGEFKGRQVKAPEGEGTRPTTDRVRESLFSTLYSRLDTFQDVCVLDAFAGSGSLGLEALSRGASFCAFCERDRAAGNILERTLKQFGLDQTRARLFKMDVLEGKLPMMRRPYNLVLLDPPYALNPLEVLAFVNRLDDAGYLAKDVLISYEHAITTKPDQLPEFTSSRWTIADSRKYGKTKITLFERNEE